jgi:uncharacterized protein
MSNLAILWRRLDAPGHDACRLLRREDGWRLEGTAVFRYERDPACLAYRVDCDDAWQSQQGLVHGWIGARPLDLVIERTLAGDWQLDGRIVPDLEGCFDLDFGFTPATNLIQLRRAALEVGRAAEIRVAWLDVPECTLTALDQRYERRSSDTYEYEAPRFAYQARLRVGGAGFVETYPDLWEVER